MTRLGVGRVVVWVERTVDEPSRSAGWTAAVLVDWDVDRDVASYLFEQKAGVIEDVEDDVWRGPCERCLVMTVGVFLIGPRQVDTQSFSSSSGDPKATLPDSRTCPRRLVGFPFSA